MPLIYTAAVLVHVYSSLLFHTMSFVFPRISIQDTPEYRIFSENKSDITKMLFTVRDDTLSFLINDLLNKGVIRNQPTTVAYDGSEDMSVTDIVDKTQASILEIPSRYHEFRAALLDPNLQLGVPQDKVNSCVPGRPQIIHDEKQYSVGI